MSVDIARDLPNTGFSFENCKRYEMYALIFDSPKKMQCHGAIVLKHKYIFLFLISF